MSTLNGIKIKVPLAKFVPHLSPGKVPYRKDVDDVKNTKKSSLILDGKRRQLESILNTEKTKEERGKLGCVLIDRLMKKFGSKHSTLITFFVEEFLTSHASISNDDITKLEKEISNALDMKGSDIQTTTNIFNSNNNEQKQYEVNNNNYAENVRITNLSTINDIVNYVYYLQNNNPVVSTSVNENIPSRPQSGSEWQVINAYQLILSEEKSKQERELMRSKKMNFKKSLDDHIKESEKVNSKIENTEEYVSKMLTDIEKYNLEEKLKFEKIRKKNADESALRQLQVVEKNKKLALEKEEMLLADKLRIERNLQLQKEEQAKIARIRKEKLDAQSIIQAENAENERLKQAQKLKDAEEDQLLMKAYADKLDRESEDRENAFKNRMLKDSKRGEKFENEGAGKAIREEQIKTERLLLKEQLLKAERDHNHEMKKLEDQKKRTQTQLMYNETMIEKKKAEIEKQRLQDIAYKEQALQNAEMFKKSEHDKYLESKRKQELYRDMLGLQVNDFNKRKVQHKGMDPIEKQINYSTLKEITEEPLVLSRVMHRMRLSKNAQTSAKVSKAPF